MKLSAQLLQTVFLSIRNIRRMSYAEANDCVSIPQLRFLTAIGEGLDQTSILARTMGVSQAAVSKMIDGMVERDWVERLSDEDRRVTRLVLSEKGKRLNQKVHSAIEDRIDVLLKDITKEERQTLKSGLQVLSKVFNSESLS